jgi:hypothetical protein
MARIDCDDVAGQPVPRKGDTVFLAKIRHANHHRADYNAANLTPFLTNMSHEEREHGWLGSSNDADEFAIGRGVVVAINGTVDDSPDWIQPWCGRLKPFLSIKVRTVDKAADTFELRPDPYSVSGGRVPARIEMAANVIGS